MRTHNTCKCAGSQYTYRLRGAIREGEGAREVCNIYLSWLVQLAEGLYEYGSGNFTKAFDILGPSFKTDQLKVSQVFRVPLSKQKTDQLNISFLCVTFKTDQ